ncbi:zinc ABC transporter substrate-binding protein [Candidatus Enterovibrio altilux]|uniref:zinc ABC transporter substrate-binding protein n=1 Tax=Candidatus Enterovibrio altilux TaxID=1927128 RepID=UPI001237BEF0|nr:zinc ABC transporter substrate-binding protein [Candidatus Enterovibrio luxaltus]
MKIILVRLLVVSAMVSSFFTNALPMSILTTIKPLALIANEIAGPNARVDTLLPSSASPHDYALKPSDIKKIKIANLVVWTGPELELPLQKILSTQKNALQLTNYPEMPVRYYGEQAGHDHHGHDHSGVDGHIWLGPEQSKVIAKAIAVYLSRIDPANAASYESNYTKFIVGVASTTKNLKVQFANNQHKGYFLFHDAYGYFEDTFGLKSKGYLTVDPARKPGAQTLVSIRTVLQNKEAQCIFTEPQFNSSIVKSVSRGTGVKLIELDPMAINLDVDKQRYKDFLMKLGNSYLDCFQP